MKTPTPAVADDNANALAAAALAGALADALDGWAADVDELTKGAAKPTRVAYDGGRRLLEFLGDERVHGGEL